MKKYKIKCEYCGKDFETNISNKKYCNAYCSGKFRNEKRVEKMKKETTTTNEISILGTQEFLGKEIPVIEGGFGEGQKVVLAKTVAEIHGVELREINQLINNNIEEFDEGVDILDIIGIISNDTYLKDKILDCGYTKQGLGSILGKNGNIYLLSEQGYMALVNLMRTDKAREIRKKFRREYFTMRKNQRILTQEECLVLEIHKGGVNGVVAHKELTKIEVDKAVEKEKEKARLEAEAERLKMERDKIEILKRLNDAQDGNNKILTLTQLVDSLGIVGLTTKMFNNWLCDKGFGEFVKFPGDKNSTFQPNERFKEYIAGKGYSFTGATKKKGKITLTYNEDMLNRIVEKYYEQLCEVVKLKKEF